MHRRAVALFLLPFCFSCAATAGEEGEPLRVARALSEAYAEVAQKALPSVVGIRCVRRARAGGEPWENPGQPPSGAGQKTEGIGSGVLLDAEGRILTNCHVIDGAERITVATSDNAESEAEVVGRDPKTDLAVIRLRTPRPGLVPARLGDSDRVRVGHIVLAVGSPFALNRTITAGIVSAKNRAVGAAMYENFIQTDASINPGNSGGPLVNLDGEVIGINTLIHSRSGGSEGIGFAVPVNLAREILASLLKSGAVTRGWLGIGIQDLTREMAGKFEHDGPGVLVTEVYPGGPAVAAGLQRGDVLLEFDGHRPRDSRELQRLVAGMEPDKVLPLVVLRKGRKTVLEVRLARQPEDVRAAAKRAPGVVPEKPAETWRCGPLGIEVQPLDDGLRRRYEAYARDSGMVVVQLVAGGPVEREEIGIGALLLELEHQPIPDLAAFRKAVEGLAGRKTALIFYRQGEAAPRFAVLRLP